MKFAIKEALVLTIPDGGYGPGRESSRFVFYIDTDAEKIAFIKWYLEKLQTTNLFEEVTPFDGFVANLPDGRSALYFESKLQEYDAAERVFPVGTDADKLALFEQILAGELGTIFGDNTMAGLHFKTVKARVIMDTERTTEALAEVGLPAELAETIVSSAVHELE